MVASSYYDFKILSKLVEDTLFVSDFAVVFYKDLKEFNFVAFVLHGTECILFKHCA